MHTFFDQKQIPKSGNELLEQSRNHIEQLTEISKNLLEYAKNNLSV